MNCSECQQLLNSFALEALDADQIAKVRAHLESGCAECTAELAEIEAVLAQLSLTLDPVAPPAQLRARLMEHVRTSRVPHMPQEQGRSQVSPIHLRRRWAEPLIAAAAAAAIASGIFWVKLNSQQHQLDAVRDDLARQEARVDQLQSGLEDQGNSIRMFASPAVQQVALRGESPQPQASGRAFWDKDRGTFHLYTANLKQPESGKVYEMWMIDSDKRKVPAGTFKVNSRGEGSLAARPPQGGKNIVALAVTDEPMGGSPQPTGQIQLLGQIH